MKQDESSKMKHKRLTPKRPKKENVFFLAAVGKCSTWRAEASLLSNNREFHIEAPEGNLAWIKAN